MTSIYAESMHKMLATSDRRVGTAWTLLLARASLEHHSSLHNSPRHEGYRPSNNPVDAHTVRGVSKPPGTSLHNLYIDKDGVLSER
jgi:hypothetical protein